MRSDYLRALRINRCIKTKTTVHNWKKKTIDQTVHLQTAVILLFRKKSSKNHLPVVHWSLLKCVPAHVNRSSFMDGLRAMPTTKAAKSCPMPCHFATNGVLEPTTPKTQKLKLKTCKMKNGSLPFVYRKLKKTQLFPVQPPGIVPSPFVLQDQPEHNHRLPP